MKALSGSPGRHRGPVGWSGHPPKGPPMFRSASRWRGGALLVATTGVLAAALLPAPALAATSDNGGAARHPDDSATALRQSIVNGPAKNVILLIGDGMGDSEIT